MAYTIDLVRLAVSAHLAVEAGSLPVKREDICSMLARRVSRKPARNKAEHLFWARSRGCASSPRANCAIPSASGKKWMRSPRSAEAPVSAVDAIEHLMPAPGISYRLAHRVAGLGSLGHARYVAIADWHGSRIAREAKALVQSSACWAESIEAHMQRRGPPKFFTRPSSTAPSAVLIPLSNCVAAGSCAASATLLSHRTGFLTRLGH